MKNIKEGIVISFGFGLIRYNNINGIKLRSPKSPKVLSNPIVGISIPFCILIYKDFDRKEYII